MYNKIISFKKYEIQLKFNFVFDLETYNHRKLMAEKELLCFPKNKSYPKNKS